MNEQQEKAKFRQAIDHTLTGLEGNPFLYQRVTALAEKGEKKMKRCIPKGFGCFAVHRYCCCGGRRVWKHVRRHGKLAGRSGAG